MSFHSNLNGSLKSRDSESKKPLAYPNTRPTIHFTATNWINDPCAPAYDHTTGFYHLFFQCNPYSCEWGNMSWGHIISKDLLTWTRMPVQLKPDEDYDKDGVFTGCFAPVASSDPLTVFYSSIRNLPFFWDKPPYPRDAAGLSMATSEDDGRTWKKSSQNPILVGEPDKLIVTGFRDPYLSGWPALDQVRGEQALYGIISGGIEGSGPTTFLYAVQPNDLTQWKYLGPLVDLPVRFQPSKKWTGNFGVNWECTNFMTLESKSASRHFLIIGAEGDVERENIKQYRLPPNLPPRTVRGQLWMSGELHKAGHEVRFVYNHAGFLDHGSYYAANTFVDPRSGRRIAYGWIPEEDITPEHAKDKGWNGALAIPRELFLLSISNVTAAFRTPLSEISSVEIEDQPDGTSILHTLGVRPITETSKLRQNCLRKYVVPPNSLPRSDSTQQYLASTVYSAWEIEASISVTPTCETVGFHIRHSFDFLTCTTITFSSVEETITVIRSASTSKINVNRCPEQGPFTLFNKKIDVKGGREELEPLHLRIFADGDTLEIFANDRFALATMVYSEDHSLSTGISSFATGDLNCATFENITVRDGLNCMQSLFGDLDN